MCEIHERVNVECVQLFFKGFISHLIVKSKSVSAIALSCKILQTLNNYLVNINIPHEIIWFRIFAVVIIFLCRQKPLKNPREYKKNDDWCVIWKKKHGFHHSDPSAQIIFSKKMSLNVFRVSGMRKIKDLQQCSAFYWHIDEAVYKRDERF